MTYRLRVLPKFPANISGADGVTVARDGVDLVVKPDYGALVQVPSVIDTDTSFFALWNASDGMYIRMSFEDVFDAVALSGGFMLASMYDPTGVEDDAFDRANHTGAQAISTVTGLQTALDAKAALLSAGTSDDTFADTDEIAYVSGTTQKRGTLTGLIASIFNGSRKIASAWFQSTFRLWDATDQTKGLGFVLSAITTATTRLITVPDRDLDLGLVPRGRFTSSDQTITSAGLLTLAHGLGGRPEEIAIDLVCATAEANWSAGDVIQNVSDVNTITSTNISNARYADATNVYYRFSSASAAFNIANKTTGATTTITNANWRVRIRAIRY